MPRPACCYPMPWAPSRPLPLLSGGFCRLRHQAVGSSDLGIGRRRCSGGRARCRRQSGRNPNAPSLVPPSCRTGACSSTRCCRQVDRGLQVVTGRTSQFGLPVTQQEPVRKGLAPAVTGVTGSRVLQVWIPTRFRRVLAEQDQRTGCEGPVTPVTARSKPWAIGLRHVTGRQHAAHNLSQPDEPHPPGVSAMAPYDPDAVEGLQNRRQFPQRDPQRLLVGRQFAVPPQGLGFLPQRVQQLLDPPSSVGRVGFKELYQQLDERVGLAEQPSLSLLEPLQNAVDPGPSPTRGAKQQPVQATAGRNLPSGRPQGSRASPLAAGARPGSGDPPTPPRGGSASSAPPAAARPRRGTPGGAPAGKRAADRRRQPARSWAAEPSALPKPEWGTEQVRWYCKVSGGGWWRRSPPTPGGQAARKCCCLDRYLTAVVAHSMSGKGRGSPDVPGGHALLGCQGS